MKSPLNEELSRITRDGLWNNNVGTVQLLGLCPLLAVSGTMINALGLGLATLLVLVSSNVAVSSIRHYVRPELRIPVFVLIIASLVTIVEQLMNAYFHDLYLILGIFLPLITTNCAIIARAEAYASKNTVGLAFYDGLMMGLGFAAVLLILGTFREVLGYGTLLANADLMFGENAKWLTVHIISDYKGFLLAILPPGAYFGLGILIAIKNKLETRARQPASVAVSEPA